MQELAPPIRDTTAEQEMVAIVVLLAVVVLEQRLQMPQAVQMEQPPMAALAFCYQLGHQQLLLALIADIMLAVVEVALLSEAGTEHTLELVDSAVVVQVLWLQIAEPELLVRLIQAAVVVALATMLHQAERAVLES
jgi:hypothetical protein